MMKRPFACIGFTCLFTLAAAVFILKEWVFSLAVIAGVFGAFSLLVPVLRRGRVVPVSLLTAAFSLVWLGCWIPGYEGDQKLAGSDYNISGQITEAPERSGEKFAYVLRVDSATNPEGEPVQFSGKLRVTCVNALAAEEGDWVTGKIYAYLLGEEFQPYYAARGIYLSSFLYEYDGVTIEKSQNKTWKGYFLGFRSRLEDVLYTLLPEREAGLISGIVLGNRDGIPEDVSNTFRMAGVSHLLAVSGLHLTILAQFLMGFLALFRLPKKLILLLLIPVVLAFMALTGFSYSILRSGIMFLLYLIAELIDRKSEGLNSLGIAVLVLCLLNPFSAGDTGLLLSFSSTLGILLFKGRLMAKIKAHLPVRLEVSSWKRPVVAVIDSMVLTVSSSVFTIPISIFAFGAVSLIAPLANLLMVFPGSVLLVLGALTVSIGSLSVAVALPLAFLAGLLARYEIGVSWLLSKIPFAVADASEPYIRFWIAGVLILVGITLLCSQRRRLFPLTAVFSAVLFLVGVVGNYILHYDTVTVMGFYSDGGYHVAAERNGRGVLLWGDVPDSYTLAQHGIAVVEFDRQESEEISFWGNALQIGQKGEDFCVFTVCGNSMMVCGEESDLSTLDSGWSSPQVLWLEGVPQEGEALSPELAIALTTESRQAPYSRILYTDDEIQLRCAPDGEMQAERR